MAEQASPHYPVMLPDVLQAMKPAAGEVYVDGTMGAGGYTKAMMDEAGCTVMAIDRDLSAQATAEKLKADYGDRFVFLSGCFGDALSLVQAAGLESVDGFVIDIGVSSMQIDQPERGFSFKNDGPLDMRMSQTDDVATAADVVNTYSEEALTQIIREYGEERHGKRVAQEIIKERAIAPIETTARLANIVRDVVPKSHKDKIDPATRTFQALRIEVNDELGELDRALLAAEKLLKPGGRLVVVSFHSLEDTRVKSFLRVRAGLVSQGSRHLPQQQETAKPSFVLPTKKALFPSEAEIAANPRSRSARMRVAIRTENPVMDIPEDKFKKGGRE
ncbi:MAG TPA: 16S rRNA (cytosine(1402)-N(4))-methyltransferase RsmH [Micavibrio sp.]|nr:16S rRNA (cytosine(1402)-N(4))-methyltransferase RsmH [Micavibrio sp.]HIL27936.1 16S rRNA (cytosine(1402)-N(4))-methyltransferase RsmH [Micavibrio sp.]